MATVPFEWDQRAVGDRGLLLAVADGMGGAQAGEVASRIAVEPEACQRLTALANERGGEDNITVIVAHFDEAQLAERKFVKGRPVPPELF